MNIFKKKQTIDERPSRRTRKESVDSPKELVRQFRRGQTMTGSSSGHIKSSSELSASLLSPRATTHHLTTHRRRLGWRLIGALVICFILYLSASQIIASVSVRSETANVSSEQNKLYAASLERYLSERPVQRFMPSLDQSGLLQYLQAHHPEIERANIVLSAELGKASLELALRSPIARWNLNGSNEFVDKRGVVFMYTPHAAPELEIVDNTGLPPSKGNVVTSTRFLGFVGLVVGGLEQRGLTVTKATIPPLTTRQLEINLSTVPYAFKLNTDRSAGEQVEDIARIVAFFQSRNETPSYVDVRVKGKGFYR